jgi:hypothetical protein
MRQALALRVAYAKAPREGFRHQAREKLLFAAGRDVSNVFANEPRAEFVRSARQRLLLAAGEQTQEALRAVPPPRLPFWINARRHLLERASQPRPQPAFRPMALALRSSLSAAVVVLAVMVAGLAYLTSQTNPPGVSAIDLASLEAQTQQVEEQVAAGEPVAPTVLIELTRKTNELAAKLDEQPTVAAAKLPALIERQRDVVNQVANDAPAVQAYQEAEQQLASAEEKVRILAAARNDPTSVPSQAAAPSVTPSGTPTPVPSTPIPSSQTPVTPKAGEIQVALLPGDTTFGMFWKEIRTAGVRFVVPNTWKIIGLTINSNGIATLENDKLRIDEPSEIPSVIISVNLKDNTFQAIVGNETIILRSADGKLPDLTDLLAKAGQYAPQTYHVAESIQVLSTPTPTPTSTSLPSTPTRTPTVAPTSTPAATNTPTP